MYYIISNYSVLKWIAITLVLLFILPFYAISEDKTTFSPYVDSEGNITRPTDFREKWTYLGSWIHPDDKKSGFHNVYTEPGVAEKYQATGKFPDGAVLVKEVLSEEAQDMTTGKGVLHAKDTVLWFVMVKDEKGRFQDNPKWGDGWGWALYYADAPSKDVATNYKKDCLGCHVPVKQTDWVYIYGYPVLNK